ncbi:cyclic nucleotide-binding domain [Calothrix sp. PCC 7716]|nr:cyclic nucleotide-binding domain [Calothrix sp. PCC 7716]
MINESDLSSWLEATLLFQGLSQSEFIPLVQIAQLQKFNKGELIFDQGSKATGFFVVKIGRVKVFKMAPTGKEQIINIFEPGENFAEVAALDGKPYPASAATLEATELIFFPRMIFLDLLHQYPNIAIKMLISVSQHSRHLAGVIEELSFKDVPQRLAAYLLNLSNKSSTPVNIVTLDLTKSQLAATLGTIPATLSRTFYRLSTEGLIAVNGSQIELLDLPRLQKLSQFLA